MKYELSVIFDVPGKLTADEADQLMTNAGALVEGEAVVRLADVTPVYRWEAVRDKGEHERQRGHRA